MKILITYTTIFLLISSMIHAQNQRLLLDELTEEIEPNSSGKYFQTDSIYTINDIRRKHNLFSNYNETLNLGFTDKQVWINIPIDHDINHAQSWYFEIDNPSLDYLKIYLIEEGKNNFISWEMGDLFPFNSRIIEHRNFIIPLDLKPKTKYQLYINAKSLNAMYLPLKFHTSDSFLESSMLSEMLFGLYFGIILIMIIYNLMIFFSLKDINYLLYIFPIFGNLFFFSSETGHSFQYLHPWSIFMQKVNIPIAISFWITTSTVFTLSFLKAKIYSKPMYYALLVMMSFGILLGIFSLFGTYETVMGTMNKVSTLNAIVLITSGIVIYNKGNKFARFFIMAWAVFSLGIFTHNLALMGILPLNFITDNALSIGVILEITLLSLALSDKFKIIQRETEIVQANLFKQQENDRKTLERRVKERTRQMEKMSSEADRYTRKIESAYGEIQSMNQTLVSQNSEIELQKKQLSTKNEKITASINYAQRIQQAILPSDKSIKHSFEDSFVLFRPKDIVSGDFYWHHETDKHIFIAAIDCTGHGVPGAFMSMIGERLFKKIVVTDKVWMPNKILDRLNKAIIGELHEKDEGTRKLKDGMDLAICVYEKRNSILNFAGAKNPLIYIANDRLLQIKGDKMSIGAADIEKFKYKLQRVVITAPTSFYIASDGYQDQFGGPQNRKIGRKKFRELLFMLSKLPFDKQLLSLNQFLNRWMEGEGKKENQIDDILVIGFQINP
ncbi:7TM diverse intracellular signaling domain-containing protein [Flammeovirga agarivorans]|uniref:SpoIIE family protein phosphatase n=1 Tax=Flammeovirga agarivorans TaxID=2726742 RepID=A0A7X8XWK3_9BACT|nr:7TM diverse intracellular signaling domain-containing protein [Flammeovirga agarivorans]NLR92299.1 SpoIIE family protein phosphatase [Flammeovirga agarivorans]